MNYASQSQQRKYRMIPLIWGIQSSQVHEDRKGNNGCEGLGGGDKGVAALMSSVSVLQD